MFHSKSIRTFIGARDYKESLDFYRALGFVDVELDAKMSYIKINDHHGFYLQDYHVKEWVDNTMLFWEVENLDECHRYISTLDLPSHFDNARLSDIVTNSWGREFFLHDPSGVLWHIGKFSS